MALEKIDLNKVTQLTSQLVDQVSCIECCKYFMVPETATCGHTLCHLCWKNRRTCPICEIPINRQSIKLNLPLQDLTEHCHLLCDSLEKVLNIKLDEFMLETPGDIGSENCPNRNVNEWLEGSQNKFSPPVINSESLSQELQNVPNQELSASKVQIHTHTSYKNSPTKIFHVLIPQDDWDKIEPIPEKDEIMLDKETIVGSTDIEPLYIDDKQYSKNNPRRSSRMNDLKNISNPTTKENVVHKNTSKDSILGTDKISNNSKKNWSNVKRMRKEFSKINKKNRNKLNVSIEMCKKTQNSSNKPNVELAVSINEQVCEIDDNTQNIANSNMPKCNETYFDEQVKESDSNVNTDVIVDRISDIKKPIVLSNTYTSKTSQAIDDSLKEKNKVNLSEKEQIPLSRSITSNTSNFDCRQKMNKIQFLKKGALCPNLKKDMSNINTNNLYIDTDSVPKNDDFEISIKIGNTQTNIYIQQKKADVQLKVNTDREIQTSLGPYTLVQTNDTSHSQNVSVQNTQINVENINNRRAEQVNDNKNKHEDRMQSYSNKSLSTKKNTSSADTATAQFEITESVEKELSNIMECTNNNKSSNDKNIILNSQSNQATMSTLNTVNVEIIHNNDQDIFDSGTIKENIKLLKNSDHAFSEILMPTIQTKLKIQKSADKRARDINSGDEDKLMPRKKIKVVTEKDVTINDTSDFNKSNHIDDPVNYDILMNQVFANIDADIDDMQKSQNNKNRSDYVKIIDGSNVADSKVINSQKYKETSFTPANKQIQTYSKDYNNKKDSENVFSMIEKDDEIRDNNNEVPASVFDSIEELLTPVACHNLDDSRQCSLKSAEGLDDGSDKSVVEDTPQKMQSVLKTKQNDSATKEINIQSQRLNTGDRISLSLEKAGSIISLNETQESRESSKNNTIVKNESKKHTSETPLTINKFVNHIIHKSTPVARKSLTFENVNDHDPEQTLCPTAESVVKNTQEKEFMHKAFENSPVIIEKPLALRKLDMLANKNFCVAGSCLNPDKLGKLKYVCTERKWVYADKYIKDITHLVVAVDEENKCQRSVKYMRALAAGKWIVTYEWIERCFNAKKYVNETQFEALDCTGEPGPRRSRLTKRKLFQGITFFCMPPFSVLDVNSLKDLLEDAGGLVVNEVKKVEVTDSTEGPRLLLAESENTQEDQFTYLAMELKIVPVNFEWALNCLGNYTLRPVQELLLCPSSLLPKATSKWPASLFACDVDI